MSRSDVITLVLMMVLCALFLIWHVRRFRP